MLTCKITNLAETVYPLIHVDIPVCIKGPTGVGKSAVINREIMAMLTRDFSNENGAPVLHDIRLSTKDIVDGTGMPIINREEMATFWTRPAFIPEDDGRMHIIFLDEFGHANVQLQQMSYSLVLDRALGGYKLPKLNRILLGSNTREDGGGDNKMLKPLENRMAHVLVTVDEKGLIEKMKEWDWDTRLIAFLSMRPANIHKVDANNAAFPTPRSIENFNRVLKDCDTVKVSQKPEEVIENAAEAILGVGFAKEFIQFLRNLTAGLPRTAEILADPKNAKVPQEAHFQWVVAANIARNVTPKNASTLAVYLERLMPDAASMAAHDAMARDAALSSIAGLKKFVLEK